ncbi:MAG: ABC transporter ATP-binding protein [Actinomycetota bacterium]|nr:ABC transporter ATP-binding protein [Actinomycetota bacterium]
MSTDSRASGSRHPEAKGGVAGTDGTVTQTGPRETSPAPARAAAVISTTGLTKVYPSERSGTSGLKAVDRLDLSVSRGEIFGLLGPNGAGKTTTVGMLTTRVIPTSGTAEVNGVDVVADPPLAKHFIGVVHQVNTLDRSLTAWENLYFHGRYYGMTAKAARAAADEQLERFRLTHRAHSEVRALSGGMARRLMVARAILHRPAVLFLDEPTASLDPQSRLALWDILREIHDEGQTILLTTHYMEEADQFCDRVAIMDHGRILALDTPAHLKRSVGNADGEGETATVKAWLSKLRAKARAEEGGVGEEPLRHDDLEGALLEVLAAADRLGLDVGDIRRGVTLETVFFNLTGRDLRE